MMKNFWFATFSLLFFSGQLRAQDVPLQELEEVTVSDLRLKHYSEGHKISTYRDSTLRRNGIFLTTLLAFNSNVYFKQNGFGMVSSPAFRGTNASHTAVVWNGININSQLNGQVDFNTINPLNYSSVGVRSGGGGVQYGTGAIGGSVHLNNDLRFSEHLEHEVLAGYGSFDSRSMNYRQSFGTGKWSSSLGVNYNRSDNDYLYLMSDERNLNGEFENLNINLNAGYVLSQTQVLRLYHQSFVGDRNLSGTLVAAGRGRYKDNQYRTQFEWGRLGKKIDHTVKLAHLHEAYTYFENKDSDVFSDGRLTTLLARYTVDFELSKKLRLNSFFQYNHLIAKSESFKDPSRNDLSATAILKHTPSQRLGYNLSVRKDFSSDFASPWVFAFDGSYAITPEYTLMLNASRNFRLPTFNDLYWQPGGNLNLRAETSYQFDLGHRFEFGSFSTNFNSYYITTIDMIRWLPTATGLWSPSNVDIVDIYGAELQLDLKFTIGKKQNFHLKTLYSYTVSQDRKTQEQLIYVPFHRGNASVAYTFQNLSAFYQHANNGSVSIIGGELEGYDVANAGITYSLNPKGKLQYRIGLFVNNLYNSYYESVALRPMPNRNINTRLTLNF